jgi:DNA-directed RNA polymerase specialized sigma subunit
MIQASRYITDPIKIKLLLFNYPAIETILINSQIELQIVYKQGTGCMCTAEEILESLAMGNTQYSDMPRSESIPGDKATNIIANYQKFIDEEYDLLLKSISDDIFILDSIVKKIYNTITRLPKEQREVLTLKYYDKRTWKQIQDITRFSESQVRGLHKLGIAEVSKLLEIDTESYAYVMNKVNRRREKDGDKQN